ncbi:hypothetical protein [Flammeovirga sp. EKP202]|uniref:hypothetical protein n=1 Tax=Flammeovirga sp. EKP202 TaxID=2770592 RepID=UPI00165EF95A|nr:hypothetical protein [Flammeovirga sp. EKP202]MBD0401414.1 hypothetical protein [Flammeovirga sp. EKP202]
MKRYLFLITLLFSFTSCIHQSDSVEMDFTVLKDKLALSSHQEETFATVVKEYNITRVKLIKNSKLSISSGNKALLHEIKKTYKNQEEELSHFLNDTQKDTLHQFILENMPGQFNYASDIRNELVYLLSLDTYQERQYKAINNTFDKIYLNMNKADYGYKQDVTAYWYQLDRARKNAIRRIFSEEQFHRYEYLIQKANYERIST